jgi:drug/metabolite transporter (DMT)-like permease
MCIFKGKIRKTGVNPTDFMVIRCAIMGIFSGIAVYFFHKPIWPESVQGSRLKMIYWMRQFLGNAAYFMNMLTMSVLPLGVTMILINTAPFWSILFGGLINGESINLV